MFTDFLLASLHHILVFALFVILGAQIVLVRPGMDASAIARVSRLDMVFGMLAASVLVAGFARVYWGVKGSAYYFANHIFLTKVGLFVIIGLISIGPTLRFNAWRKALAADPNARPEAGDMRRTRMFIHAEATLIFLLPILAAAMARGYGIAHQGG